MTVEPHADAREHSEYPPPRRIYAAMSGLVVAFVAANLDFTIVGTALPTIAAELGGFTELSHVVTAFAVATAVTTPIWGKLGDLYDRKTVFLAAFSLFLLGSALCGAAQTMAGLIGFRVVQGLGAGGLLVGGIAIVGELVPPRERAKYQGLMAVVMPLAILAGPVIGGLCADGIGWRWAFYLNLPLGAVATVLLLTQLRLPRRERASRGGVDRVGMALLGVSIVAVTVLTSTAGNRFAWISPPVIASALLAAATLAVFVWWERRSDEPVVPMTLFGVRNYTLAALLGFLSGLVMFGAVTFVPVYQQVVHGLSATNSGLLLLPLLGGMLVTAPVVGALVSRTGRFRRYPIVGAAVMTAGLFLLAGVDEDTGQLVMVAAMLAVGVGMGCFMQLTVVIAQNSVADRDLGAASATAMLARNLGNSLGVSVLGAAYAWQLARSLGGAEPGVGMWSGEAAADLTQVSEPMRAAVRAAVADGVADVFLIGGICSAAMFLVALALRDVALTSHH
ncbi:MDR family MFS transporter [Nocardia cyriacigeorgica]|uniref:MDR family MFS transporter n=1 Tax=Nocardia cyriacigeorgica TaxID=135487 RepID=UPI002459017E|nr:MDR family MFS transporter [Nocardia cyriacigeorgica]